jgi:hypothetical protein
VPHRILEAKSDVTFRIKSVLLPDKPSQVVHVDRLKRYYPRRDGSMQLEDFEAARQLELRLDDTEGNAFGMPADKVVDKRTVRGRCQYRVRWQDFPAQQDTWEDAETLGGITHLIDEFMSGGRDTRRRHRNTTTQVACQTLAAADRGGMWGVGPPSIPEPPVVWPQAIPDEDKPPDEDDPCPTKTPAAIDQDAEGLLSEAEASPVGEHALSVPTQRTDVRPGGRPDERRVPRLRRRLPTPEGLERERQIAACRAAHRARVQELLAATGDGWDPDPGDSDSSWELPAEWMP